MTSLLAPRSSTGTTNFLIPRDPPTSSSWSNCCPRNLLPLYLFSLGLKIGDFPSEPSLHNPGAEGPRPGRGPRTPRGEGGAHGRNPLPAQALGAGGGRGAAGLSQRSRNPGPRDGWGRLNPSGPAQARPVPTPVPPSSSLCL